MAAKNSQFASRGPMYFGGLLLGLAAGVALYKAKHAMMPTFHETQETKQTITLAPAATFHLAYSEDPGYFLIPGLPSAAVIYKRGAGGQNTVIASYDYGQLVEKEPVLGPVTEEGDYNLAAELYICAQPGVADCTKLVLSQDFKIDRNASTGDDRIALDLPALAQEGLRAGNAQLPAEGDTPKKTAE